MTRLIPALVLAAFASVAFAQTQPTAPIKDPVADLLRQTDAVGNPNTYDGPADETPRDPTDPELAVTAELNAEIARRDREIEASNARGQAEYEAEMARVEAETLRIQADHEAARLAYQETLARQTAEHEAAMAAWRRCAAGERAYCLPAGY